MQDARLTKFKFYLERRGIIKASIPAHITRAATIFSEKDAWTREEAEEWILQRAEEREYTGSTVNKWNQTFNRLNDCFEWDWKNGLSQKHVTNQAREVLSLEETLKFYNLHTTEKYDLIIKLSVTTGARPSEILTLQRKEVDLERELITLNHTKTKKNRILIIQKFLLEELRAYIEKVDVYRDDYIFYYKDKTKHISIEVLEREYRKRLKMLSIDKKFTPYCARHAYITRMASRVNSIILKELAGHTDIRTTEHYMHNNEFILREAAEKDFLFDHLRDFDIKIQNIVTSIDELANKPNIDQIKLQEAKLYLLQAVRSPQSDAAYLQVNIPT